jgi:hypothetical protein
VEALAARASRDVRRATFRLKASRWRRPSRGRSTRPRPLPGLLDPSIGQEPHHGDKYVAAVCGFGPDERKRNRDPAFTYSGPCISIPSSRGRNGVSPTARCERSTQCSAAVPQPGDSGRRLGLGHGGCRGLGRTEREARILENGDIRAMVQVLSQPQIPT